MAAPVTFVCDRCGAMGRAAAVGRTRCGACGRVVVVEGPIPTPATGTPVPDPPAEATPAPEEARTPAGVRLAPLAPPSGPNRFEQSEILPGDLPPPEDGYVDLVLDDDEQAPAAVAPGAAARLDVTAPIRPERPGPPPLPPVTRTPPAAPLPAPPEAAPARIRKVPRLAAAAVLFVAGATLAVGVTVAGRAAWRGSPDGAAPAVAPAPTDTAPAPPAAVDTAQPPAPAEPAADLAAAPAEAAPPAPAPAPPQRKGSRRVAEASVSISARPLVSSPRRVARAEPAPQDDPEPPTHGLPAPLPIVVASAAPRPPVVEDAPAYPGDGFRRPAPADRGCVERALRLPSDLAGPLDGTLTVKFPVSAEGTVGRIEVLGDLPDPRVVPAVQAAIRACRFLPGADAQGKPTALWAVMPLRFVKR